jgi:hypothetical protein
LEGKGRRGRWGGLGCTDLDDRDGYYTEGGRQGKMAASRLEVRSEGELKVRKGRL